MEFCKISILIKYCINIRIWHIEHPYRPSISSCMCRQSSWSSPPRNCNRRRWLGETHCRRPSNPQALNSGLPSQRGSCVPSVSPPAPTGRTMFLQASPPSRWDPFSSENQSEELRPPPSPLRCQPPPGTHCPCQSRRSAIPPDITWSHLPQPLSRASWAHGTGRSNLLEMKWMDIYGSIILEPCHLQQQHPRWAGCAWSRLREWPGFSILQQSLCCNELNQMAPIYSVGQADPPGCNREVEGEVELVWARQWVKQLPGSREIAVPVSHLQVVPGGGASSSFTNPLGSGTFKW